MSDRDVGPDMSAAEVAALFGEKTPENKGPQKPLRLTPEEIEEWEEDLNNGTDIYAIAGRVKNLAREGGANLTGVGVMLTNTYVHVIKSFYDFANTIEDKDTKIRLCKLIKANENMPANFIAAVKGGVKE